MISSPNTNVLMALLNDAVRGHHKPTAAGYKIVYVGKDKTPLSILEMAPIEGDAWKKSASFESLSSTIRGQMESYSSADLISVISQELPVDVTTAFMESMKIKDTMVSSMTNIDTLSGISFLHGNGQKSKSLASGEAKDRIEDLCYIKLSCYLDGSTVDKRISQPGIDLQFCLKLPQSSYDPNTGDIISLATPGTPAKPSPHSPKTKLVFDADSDDSSSTPVKPATPTKNAVTPKMSRLFGSTSSGQTITSYFGSMSFLDDQVEFDKIFGENPVILGVNPVSGSSSGCLKKARLYADKCMLDVFLHI